MEKEILYKFFDGRASKEEKEAVRLWLKDSKDHEKELFKEREFFDATILSEKIAQMEEKKEPDRPFINVALREFLKIAAVVAIMLVGSVYFYQSRMAKLALTMNTITASAGQRVNVTLPDGTKVWLNARSEMQYPAVFIGSIRRVKLIGEAYFEVKHDKHSPFIVQTKRCNIKVLGTKFNVEAYDDSNDFCTSLMQGSVEVSDNRNHSSRVILEPNYQVSIVNGQLKTEAIQDYDLFRWREGLICFKDVTFEQLMVRFEKCYGIHVSIQNDKVKTYVCSGKFRISDGIDNALRILQKDARYTFVRDEDNTTIYIK